MIALCKENRIEMLCRNNFYIGNLDRGYELVALERSLMSKETEKDVNVELMITQTRSSYLMFSKQHILT